LCSQVYKYDEASFLSRMTFSWMIPLVRLGYRTPLEKEDLRSLPETEKAKVQYQVNMINQSLHIINTNLKLKHITRP